MLLSLTFKQKIYRLKRGQLLRVRPWPQLLAGSGGKVVAALPLTRLFSRFFLWRF